MKKIILASVLAAGSLFSLGAFADATVICTGASTAGSGAVPPNGTAGTHYMVVAITPKCSANVNMAGTDGTSGAWVCRRLEFDQGEAFLSRIDQQRRRRGRCCLRNCRRMHGGRVGDGQRRGEHGGGCDLIVLFCCKGKGALVPRLFFGG